MTRDSSGQALVELAISILALAITLSGAGWVFHAAWDREHCAVLVFEKTHARLTGSSGPGSRIAIEVRGDENGATGSGQCGESREEVSLPGIEGHKW